MVMWPADQAKGAKPFAAEILDLHVLSGSIHRHLRRNE